VDPAVAHLLVSGSYTLEEPDRSLRAAVAQLPVRLLVQDQRVVRILPL
jgi:ferric-dicitrate binding protein FerR (iron transport regulator)